MQTNNRLFDDLARVANGAAGTLAGMRAEVETLIKARLERLMAEMDVVPRDEFEALKAMALKARADNEALAARVADLEAAAAKPKRAAAPKKAASRKPANG